MRASLVPRLILLSCLVLASGCAANNKSAGAQPPAPSPSQPHAQQPSQSAPGAGAPQNPGDNPEALVCTTEYPTGSHRPRRVCRTQRQIEEERRAAEEMMRRAQQNKQPLQQ